VIFLPKIKTFNHTSTLAHEIDYMVIVRFFNVFCTILIEFVRTHICDDWKVTRIVHVSRSIQCQINF